VSRGNVLEELFCPRGGGRGTEESLNRFHERRVTDETYTAVNVHREKGRGSRVTEKLGLPLPLPLSELQTSLRLELVSHAAGNSTNDSEAEHISVIPLSSSEDGVMVKESSTPVWMMRKCFPPL